MEDLEVRGKDSRARRGLEGQGGEPRSQNGGLRGQRERLRE